MVTPIFHLDVFTISKFFKPKGWQMPAFKANPFDRAIFLIDGEVKFVFGEADHPVIMRKGDMMVIPRGELHRSIFLEDSSMILIGSNEV